MPLRAGKWNLRISVLYQHSRPHLAAESLGDSNTVDDGCSRAKKKRCWDQHKDEDGSYRRKLQRYFSKRYDVVDKDMLTSASAASLAALSNRSVHGSDGEADPNDVESTVSSRAAIAEDSIFIFGSGSTTPPLNKLQFASALIHLMQTDDHFLAQIHQAYVDAINRRLNRN